MLDKLEFARGRIVMALEGGYNLKSIASSARACVEVLLHDKPPNVVLEASPFAATWRLIQEVCRELSTYWPVLAVQIPFTASPESDDSFLALSPGTQERVSLECCYHGVFLAEIKAALEKFPELEKMPKSLVMIGKLMFYFQVRIRDISTLRDVIKMKSMAQLMKYGALLKDAFSFNTFLEDYKRKFSLIRDFITSEQAAQPAATSEDLLIHYGLIKESTWVKPAKQETAQNAVEIAAEKTQDEAAYHQTMNTGWTSQRQLNPTLTRCTQLKSWWSD